MVDLIKHSGQVFTPNYLVNNILDEAGYFGEAILRKHCIDNSCGDGAFLCEIVRRYISAYKNNHSSLIGIEEELKEFIHGIELDKVAFECCKVNLLSILCEYGIEDVKIDIRQGNTLIIHEFDGKMDFVIGNPPYVRVHNLEDNYSIVKSYSFSNGGMTDLYLVFFEIGFTMLKDGGKLCYITPSSWINSVAGCNLRSYVQTYRNLLSIIDLGHYQAFKATTYTMISLFQKGESNNKTFRFNEYNAGKRAKEFICDIKFEDVNINNFFYLSDNDTLEELRKIILSVSPKYVSVKNGFATLSDNVFISDIFPFTEFTIPVIKASTGKWYKAFYPYDEFGKPLSKEMVFSNDVVSKYLNSHKADLLKGSNESQNPYWYLFGRTQALKDVYTNKAAINTTIKDVKSVKINKVPVGAGVYSGLYILSNLDFGELCNIICTDEFIKYIASLRKYKSGGYYTYNSKDLELFLNFKISQLIKHGRISSKPINK